MVCGIHFLMTEGLLQGLMFWWLWMRNLNGQGTCNAIRDMKTDSPNPFPWGLWEAELPFPVG